MKGMSKTYAINSVPATMVDAFQRGRFGHQAAQLPPKRRTERLPKQRNYDRDRDDRPHINLRVRCADKEARQHADVEQYRFGLPRMASKPAPKPAQAPGRVRRLSRSILASAWRISKEPMIRNTTALQVQRNAPT